MKHKSLSKPMDLRAVLRLLTPQERDELAAAAKTTAGALHQIALGRRGASATMAINIDRAAAKLGLNVPRSRLNAGCAGCEYAKTCEKARKTNQGA